MTTRRTTKPAGNGSTGTGSSEDGSARSAPAAIIGRYNLAMSDLDVFKVTAPSAGYPPNT
jgi:hypothetical protein